MKYLITLILSGILLQANATNYYFANKGKDSNKGINKQSAWKSIAKINGLKLKAGDSILLKRGDVFEGSILLNQSGLINKLIVISAYGTGKSPILTGAKLVNNWNEKNGIYSASFNETASDLYINDVKQTLARYPNQGFITLDSGKNKQVIYSKQIKDIPGNINGAFVRVRSIDWVYEIRKVQSFTPNSISLAYHDLYAEEKAIKPRTSNGKSTIYELKEGYGFYLDGLAQFIDTPTEWSMGQNAILFKPQPGINTKKSKIEAVVYEKGITIADGVKHVRIENLQIEKYFYAAITVGVEVEKISINNCNIKNTHVYGIFMDSLSQGCKITNNKITDILGKGVSVLEPENMLIEANQVKRIGLKAGHGFSGINGASAISIYNHESKTFKKEKYANHNIVRLNRVDSCGYNGIRVDGSYNLVEYNTIENCGLTLNDGSALYCFAMKPGITHHQTFRRNIVKNSKGNNEATPANGIHFNGIYIDNNSHDMIIEENTSIGNSSAGLMNNVASFNNSFIKNNVLNSLTGIGFYEWGDRIGQTYGNKVFNNTIAASDTSQALVQYSSYVLPKTNFAKFDNNNYIHTAKTNPFYNETKQIPNHSKLNLAFNDWQAIGNHDKNSTAIMADHVLLKDFALEVIINDSMKEKEYDFTSENYRNAKGEVISKPIKLGAFQSVIMLKRK